MKEFATRSEALGMGLDKIRHDTEVPGLSIFVSTPASSAFAHAGVAALDPHTYFAETSRFEVSCIMKLIISALVYRDSLRGRISLSSRIAEHLPELEIAGDTLVGHLMSHSSGLPGLDIGDSRTKWAYSWQHLVDHANRQGTRCPPGVVFNYEHSEHVILGEILSRLYDREILDIVNDEVFSPLGIQVGCSADDRRHPSTFVGQHVFSSGSGRFTPHSIPPFGKFWQASLPNMTISLGDVVTIGKWMMAEHFGSLFQAMQQPVIDIPKQVPASSASEQLPRSFGYICAQYGDEIVGHNGSSFGQTVALRIDAKRQAVVAVGVNAWVPCARDASVKMALSVLSGSSTNDGDHSPRPIPFHIDQLTGPFSLKDLQGDYVGSLGGRVSVELTDSGLSISVGAVQARRATILVEQRADGMHQMITRLPVSCCFQPHPVDSSPVCFLGVHSYQRQ